MILRLAHATVQRLSKGFPILAITGPRQSGKTTLARLAYPAKPYVSLENPEERSFAQNDPKRFLARFPEGAVIDEVQRVPELLSWLQQLVDERKRMADFVLTGSAQFDLMAGITQSLAGRVGRIELLPFSSSEATRPSLDELMFTGGYPALYDRELSPLDWFPRSNLRTSGLSSHCLVELRLDNLVTPQGNIRRKNYWGHLLRVKNNRRSQAQVRYPLGPKPLTP
jgi:uncharacterized protein